MIARVNKRQSNMSYKGELQTLNKQCMRHQVCPSETCRTTISKFAINMLMFMGRQLAKQYYMYIQKMVHNNNIDFFH